MMFELKLWDSKLSQKNGIWKKKINGCEGQNLNMICYDEDERVF